MTPDLNESTTHFGYRNVPVEEKSALVSAVFHSVAKNYDVMNDVMSLGFHRLWKRFVIQDANVRPAQVVLDVASGTGDLAKAFAKIVGKEGKVILSDINESMLAIARDRLTDAGMVGNVDFVQADAENLPFADNEIDCITMAFGLRNVTDKSAALRSLYRVLKPGGKLLILEFSHPPLSLIKKFYDLYSFHLIPKMGEIIAKDRVSYQYLVESIRMHPDQDTLKTMMLESCFDQVNYTNLSGGIVALHRGYKY